ncbi:hypothetical protein BGW80DRAFT_1260935 [Lactifluus volemus]|nr:hypothetical protein BGW80DRAFT_1260935 [Lactifluus volemus]
MSFLPLPTALLLFSQLVLAQIVVQPTCPQAWSWSFNSLGQNPCIVAAYLQGACDNGVYTIPKLNPGDSYTGPSGPADASDLCKCNTVVYSLMSACDACQGARWFPWATFSANCTAVDPLTTFSNVIPTGTAVPEWAFLNISTKGTWDPVLAYQVGDAIELDPGATGVLEIPPTPTTTRTVVPGLSTHHNRTSKIGAVIGGLIGGVIAVAAALALFLWRARVKRRKATRAAAAVILANRSLSLREKGAKGGEEGGGGPHDVPLDTIRVTRE